MQMRLRDVIILLLWAPTSRSHDQHLQGVAAQGSTVSSFQSAVAPTSAGHSRSATTSTGNATCPSRTVNYITHTLPQQCLRTDRAPSASSRTVNTTSQDDSIRSLNPDLSNVQSTTGGPETDSPPEKVVWVGYGSTLEDLNGAASSQSSSTLTPVTSISPAPHPPVEIESDSPLDNANFLSFEEWKRQNLAKAGQSPDNVGRAQPISAGRQHPGIYNILDTFGDENEISLDFAGFGAGTGPHQPGSADSVSVSTISTDIASIDQPPPGSLETRSKDAGKTCKERTNYASFDCAANVLKSNSECKSASSVLVENKDNYMLNICSAKNKYFVVELCDDILVDTVVLANYEFFSSSFRHFRVSVSDRYPVKEEKWRELGTYEARNTREIQAFLVENPLIWARYLRVEFLTHYGNEYYCPVSLLRVHGTTMIQEYLHHEDSTRDDPIEEVSSAVGEVDLVRPATSQAEQTTVPRQREPSTAIESKERSDPATYSSDPSTNLPVEDDRDDASAAEDKTLTIVAQLQKDSQSNHSPIPDATEATSYPETLSTTSNMQYPDRIVTPDPKTSEVEISSTLHGQPQGPSETLSSASLVLGTSTQQIVSGLPTVRQNMSQAANLTVSGITDVSAGAVTNGTVAEATSNQPVVSNQVAASTNTSRSAQASSTSSHQSQPSTQESFFKSVHKRLQQLESNSTLSLQYIEEQSRILRDAFSKVEKRQVSATTTFLSTLNQTVMNDLHGFRQAYDQLWQSTVIELEGQREQFQREMLAMSSRLTLVADELVWQKRMGIVQSTLVLMCLALVLFGRSGTGSLEFPIMQQMMVRSTAALRAGWESPPNSPSPVSRSPARIFRPRLWRSNTEHSHLTDSDPSRPQSVDGPDVMIEPPTPGTPDTRSDVDEQNDGRQIPLAAKPMQPTSPPPSKKRRKRRQSLSNRNGKPKSPLAHS